MDAHSQGAQDKGDPRQLRVWDIPQRVFHWLLVALILTSWITSEIGGNAMTYHLWSGYAILTLVAFRILWGFAGSRHARFVDFLYGPRAMLRYACGLMRLNPPYYLGHNPLGGISVVLMLLCVLLQATTGLFANDEIATEGPLVHLVSESTSSVLTTIHRYNFYVLLGLVAAHIAAALFYLIVKHDNLIGAMFSGRKRVPVTAELSEAPFVSNWRALLILLLVAAAVAALVNGL